MPLKTKIEILLDQLSQKLIERNEATRLILLAALAGEHSLLIGPPGTAKSELAKRLHLAFDDGQYFERLLTRFSVPEELFGPLSIKALENDQYRRLVTGYLPEASIAFIDEIFKANSAILNTLLTLLNEREFDNGAERNSTPLISVIAASNELPENEELDALYDRFLVRYQIKPISDAGFDRLINLDDSFDLNVKAIFTTDSIIQIQAKAQILPLAASVVNLLSTLRKYLIDQNIFVSDRRWRKVIKLLKVAAYTNQQSEVTVWDCWLFQHCLWDIPEHQALILDWYKDNIGAHEVIDLQRLNKLVDTWQNTLNQEQNQTTPLYNETNEKLYHTPQGGTTTEPGFEYFTDRGGEALYLSPGETEQHTDRSNQGAGYTKYELENDFFDDFYRQRHINGKWVTLESYTTNADNRLKKYVKYDACQKPKTFSEAHINDRCDELQTLLSDIKRYQQHANDILQSHDDILSNHLWISPDFSETASTVLIENVTKIQNLTKKITDILTAFRLLRRSN